MSRWTPTPPVFTGGAQPFGQRKETPGLFPPFDNPPFANRARLTATDVIARAWNFATPIAQGPNREWVIQASGAVADNPPFGIKQSSWMPNVLSIWATAKRPPTGGGDPAPPPDNPPVGYRNPSIGVLPAWQFTPPAIQVREFVVQGIAGTFDNPPFGTTGLRSTMPGILAIWATAKRPPTGGGDPAPAATPDDPPFGYKNPNLNAIATWNQPYKLLMTGAAYDEVVVDDPPFSERSWQANVARSWNIEPPKPYQPRYIVQGLIPDDPPFGLRQPFYPIVAQWQPVAPRPYFPEYVVQGERIDEPPYGLRQPYAPIYQMWQPVAPRPYLPTYLVQGVVPDNPPFGLHQPMLPIIQMWQPVAPRPYLPTYQVQGERIDDPPIGYRPWHAATISAWQFTPPAIQIPAKEASTAIDPIIPPDPTPTPVLDTGSRSGSGGGELPRPTKKVQPKPTPAPRTRPPGSGRNTYVSLDTGQVYGKQEAAKATAAKAAEQRALEAKAAEQAEEDELAELMAILEQLNDDDT